MAAITLNGVKLPVLRDGGALEPHYVQDSLRAYDGTPRRTRYATKRVWHLKMVPQDQASIDPYKRLISGEGHTLPFDADLYSSKGLPNSGGSGQSIGSTFSPKYGAGHLTGGANRLAFAEWAGSVPAGSAWSIFLWRIDGPVAGSSWHHWIVTSTGGLYMDGVTTAIPACAAVDGAGKLTINGRDKQETLAGWVLGTVYSIGNRISVVFGPIVYIMQCTVGGTSGGTQPTWNTTFNATTADNTVTWRCDGRGGLYVDDAVVVPFAIPASWAPQIYTEANTRAMSLLPRLTAGGDLVQSAPATVMGEYASGPILFLRQAGVTVLNAESPELTLSEV